MSTPLPEPVSYVRPANAATVVLDANGVAVRNPDGTYQTRTPQAPEPAFGFNFLAGVLGAVVNALNAVIAWIAANPSGGSGPAAQVWDSAISDYAPGGIWAGPEDPATQGATGHYLWLNSAMLSGAGALKWDAATSSFKTFELYVDDVNPLSRSTPPTGDHIWIDTSGGA